ncbi:MAG: YcaO-like family protein [Deltaproteobacteria bacterium]|nr:YcaO-like family protein [Deltaproteobacteria bacterium]
MNISSNISLKSSPKTYTQDLDKAIPPAETVKNVKAVLQRIDLKLVNDISRIDYRRLDIPVYVCEAGKDCNTPGRKTMGKGSSPEQAEASALMELIERFSHANYPHSHKFRTGRYSDFEQFSIPFDRIFHVPHRKSFVPEENKEKFKELSFCWLPAYSLLQKKDFMIPYEWFADIQGTNGLSAGNTLEEAVLQGLSEVIERHVSSVINCERRSVPTIDLASVRDPVARDLIRKYIYNGIELFIKDFSMNIGIPTIAGIAFDPSSYPQSMVVMCAATATHPEKALIRVLTEIQQMAIDYFKQDYYAGGILPKFYDIREAEYLISNNKTVSIDELPDVSDNDILIELENYTKALDAIDFEPIVIDTTHPVLRIPSVFVLVPGSELYDNSKCDLNSYYYLARRMQHTGNFEKAIENYRLSISRHPASSCHANFEMGECFRHLKEYQEASDCYKTSLRYSPDRNMQYRIFDSLTKCNQLLQPASL